MALHVVLLAGGSGTRFWPLSRAARPKQFLDLAGDGPLLHTTWSRARRLAPASRIWVAAPRGLARRVRSVLPDCARSRLIAEPGPRDTGPAIVLACLRVMREDPDATVAVLPTDHHIADLRAFVRAIRVAQRAAAEGGLICLGVRPDRPATGFGYLRCKVPPVPERTVPVAAFVEKPDRRKAQRWLRSGRHLWNAGMFVWRADRFLGEVERVCRPLLRSVRNHVAGQPGAWDRAPRLSVDFAVMEHARDVRVVLLDAGWDDLGSWDSVARLQAEGRTSRPPVLLDSPGTVAIGDRRQIAVIGVPGVVVVDTADALLVVARESTERTREVVAELRRRGRGELL